MNKTLPTEPELYPKIMDKRNFAKIVDMMTPDQKREIMDMTFIATEKVHGTNFRIGTTEGKDGKSVAFIGTRKHFYTERISDEFIHTMKDEQHPEWNRIPQELRDTIKKIHADMTLMAGPMTAFGELYGPGIQKGFNWHNDHVDLFLVDVRIRGRMLPINEHSGLPFYNYINWSKVLFISKLKDALQYNIEELTSSYSDDTFVEGIVLTPRDPAPEWWSELVDARLIIKIKTKKYAEAASAPRPTKPQKKEHFISEYGQFVNKNRFEHVIQALNDELGLDTIKYEMKDLQILIPATITDIVMEENSNVPLMKQDSRSMHKIIAEEYSKFLDARAEESLA